MVRRHEVQILRRAGHSLLETAKLVGVSQRTVQRVEAEAAVASFDAVNAARRKRSASSGLSTSAGDRGEVGFY